MKRLLMILLACMVALSLAGCGTSADTAALESENAELKERIAALESAQASEPSAEIAETSTTEEVTPDPTPEPTEEATPEPTEAPSFEEQLLMDQDGLVVYFRGFDPEGSFSGPTIDLRIENNTDRDYIFQTRDFSIGNILTDVGFSETVAPGKISNCDITIYQTSLDENGINAVDSADFKVFYAPRDAMVSEGKTTDPILLTLA